MDMHATTSDYRIRLLPSRAMFSLSGVQDISYRRNSSVHSIHRTLGGRRDDDSAEIRYGRCWTISFQPNRKSFTAEGLRR